MGTHMGSKNISIRDDTYEKLRARKQRDESFTDVIERLMHEEKDFEAGFGSWSGTDADAVARETRAEMNETIERRSDAAEREQ